MIIRTLLLILFALSTTGCISTLEVAKVPAEETADNAVSGLRYSLPATFVVVEPDPSTRGGFRVETRLFPDQSETYAIDADTYLGNLTFNVELEEGMLKSVTYNADSAPVAEAAIGAFGEVIKADLDQEKEERKKAEEAAKEKKKKLEDLQKAVTDAEKALAAANTSVREWERVVGRNLDEKDYQKGLVAARVEQTQAIVALEQARAALAAAQASVESGSDSETLGAVGDQPLADVEDAGTPEAAIEVQPEISELEEVDTDLQEADEYIDPEEFATDDRATDRATAEDHEFQTIRGPVVYRLRDNCDPWGELAGCTVELVPIEWYTRSGSLGFQPEIPTVQPLAKKADRPKPPKLLVQSYDFAPVPITFPKSAAFSKDLPFDKPICGLTAATTLRPVEAPGKLGKSVLEKVGLTYSMPTVDLEIRKGDLEAGTYKLSLHYGWGKDCEKANPGEASFYFSIGS